jgi:hypothetical protein
LGERDEAVGCFAALDERRTDAEELRTVIDQAVAVAVERQERFIAARPHPLHAVGKTIRVDVERNAAARDAQLDAVPSGVDDDRAALCPSASADQAQKNAQQNIHRSPFLSVMG